MAEAELEIHPLTADRWDDLATLFDRPGDQKGCWCMFWRVRGREFDRLGGTGARAAFREVVEEGPPPGLLAYRDGAPVGWCAVAPRDTYPRVLHSRVLGVADDAPAWSVVCFYVVRNERRGGVAAALLEAAVAFAADHGATVVEGYPKDTEGGRKAANELYVGSMAMFAEAGFEEAARNSPKRPIMRRRVGAGQRARRPRRARR